MAIEDGSVKTKKKPWSKKDYVIVLVWVLSVFSIVISTRLISLPSNEFPVPLTFLVILITFYITATSYASTLTSNKSYSPLVHIIVIAFMYFAPALIVAAILNGLIPKTIIEKKEREAIEIRYDGFDGVSFWFDADVTYERPFIPLIDVTEIFVGKIYYNNKAYIADDCANDHDFYEGEAVNCYLEDEVQIKARLDLNKLSYKVK